MADFEAIYKPNFPVCTNKINFNRDGGGPTPIFTLLEFYLFSVFKGVLTVRIGFNLGFFDTSMAYYSELGKEFLHTHKKKCFKKILHFKGGLRQI